MAERPRMVGTTRRVGYANGTTRNGAPPATVENGLIGEYRLS